METATIGRKISGDPNRRKGKAIYLVGLRQSVIFGMTGAEGLRGCLCDSAVLANACIEQSSHESSRISLEDGDAG